jgi:glycolate oxidase iron-sulfur subunit
VGHIRTTGADIVATANPGCHLQIARGLKNADAQRTGDVPGVVTGGSV